MLLLLMAQQWLHVLSLESNWPEDLTAPLKEPTFSQIFIKNSTPQLVFYFEWFRPSNSDLTGVFATGMRQNGIQCCHWHSLFWQWCHFISFFNILKRFYSAKMMNLGNVRELMGVSVFEQATHSLHFLVLSKDLDSLQKKWVGIKSQDFV